MHTKRCVDNDKWIWKRGFTYRYYLAGLGYFLINSEDAFHLYANQEEWKGEKSMFKEGQAQKKDSKIFKAKAEPGARFAKSDNGKKYGIFYPGWNVLRIS